MNVLLAPLRPLADVLDLTAEAVAAVGTVTVTALSLALDRRGEAVDVGETPQQPVSSTSR